MIALSIALVLLGAMALYAWEGHVMRKYPRADSPQAEFNELKRRVGNLELRLMAKPEIPKPAPTATIFSRLG